MYFPWRYSPLRVRAFQPTAGLTFTYPQTEVKFSQSVWVNVKILMKHGNMFKKNA